jgi:hypothetical protein
MGSNTLGESVNRGSCNVSKTLELNYSWVTGVLSTGFAHKLRELRHCSTPRKGEHLEKVFELKFCLKKYLKNHQEKNENLVGFLYTYILRLL